MSYICRVRKPDGSFNDDLPFVKLERTNKLNEMETARVWVPAPDAQNQTIVEDQDEIQVLDEGTFTRWDGVITEVRQHADRHELVSDGFERYARFAEPIAGTQDYSSATDDTIVSDAVSNVSQLSAGTINQVNSDTFDVTFYFASQALKIRRMREAANVAYVDYNFNKTVDYKATLGSDKTGNANLSPNNRNITDFRVNRSDPQPTPTHIRVIGNNGNYEDVVSSSYSQGDNQIWLRAYYNDLSSSTLLTSTGEQLLAELEADTERIEVTIPGPADKSQGISPSLGDQYHIKYPDYDVDRDATIAEITEIIDKEGTHYEVVFSDRDVTFDRDDEHEVRSSLKRRFNETESTGGVRTDVSDSGSIIVEEVEDINFDQNLSVTDDGDQTVTVDSTGGGGGSLSLKYSLETAKYSPEHVDLPLSSESISAPDDMTWNDDGTQLFMCEDNDSIVAEYSLSTAYDITTMSHVQDVSGFGSPSGIAWNNDGTKLYLANNNRIKEFSLSTPYDLSTRSENDTLDISNEVTLSGTITWNDDGSRVYVVASNAEYIYQYNCSPNFDVSTGTTDSNNRLNIGVTSGPYGIALNDDGTRLYTTGYTAGVGDNPVPIYEYHLRTAYDVNSGIYTYKWDGPSWLLGTGILWNDDGTELISASTYNPTGLAVIWAGINR